MKILIDMNLSPEWREVFAGCGWDCVHWSEVGEPSAPDSELMCWARENGFVVFTHDLDFGALLAACGASKPSVVQLRSQDTRPNTMGQTLTAAIRECLPELDSGALVTVNPLRMRITLLPLR